MAPTVKMKRLFQVEFLPNLPPYLPVGDENNRFQVEDGPRAMSTVSVLSDITIESSVASLDQVKNVSFVKFPEAFVKFLIFTGFTKFPFCGL